MLLAIWILFVRAMTIVPTGYLVVMMMTVGADRMFGEFATKGVAYCAIYFVAWVIATTVNLLIFGFGICAPQSFYRLWFNGERNQAQSV